MHSAVLVIVCPSIRPPARLSVTLVHGLCPHDNDFFTVWQSHDSRFLAPNFASIFQRHDLQIQGQIQVHGVGKTVVFSIKTACISETVSDRPTAKVTIDH